MRCEFRVFCAYGGIAGVYDPAAGVGETGAFYEEGVR